MIPKIIWQTHENKYDQLEDFQKQNTRTWINLNPDWEYKYIDAEERAKIVESYDARLYKSYLKEPNVTQADIFRYIVTYQHGGVYADMDSVCRQPLTYFLNNNYNGEQAVCTQSFYHPDKEVVNDMATNNSNFAVIKESPMIGDILKDLQFAFRMKLEAFIDPYQILPIKYNTWTTFSNSVQKHKNSINFNLLKTTIHEEVYKNSFEDFFVDYHGEKITYLNLVSRENWKLL
jgi:hypothetical protein